MLHPFISNAGPRPSRSRPLLISAAVHAALLVLVITPVRPAHFASVPRAVGETIQYLNLSVSTGHGRRAAPAPRRARVAARALVFATFDYSLATNVVSTEVTLPELETPHLVDSLWSTAAGSSPFATGTSASGDSAGGLGTISDSITYLAANVDRSAVSAGGNPKPVYPPDLLYRSVEAAFSVYFVVDTAGRVDMATLDLPPAVDPRFLKAVRDVLVRWRFIPGEIRGRRVRQFLEQPFEFRIVAGSVT